MNLNFLGKLSFGNSLRWTIGKKLALGFGTVLALMLISAAVTFYEVEEMKKIQDRVIELRIPTAQAGDAMLDGINHSLAALRGYIILGADPEKAEVFKKQRQVAWDNINKSVNKLTKFSKNWTVPANVKIFKDLRTEIDLFRTAQQEVEDIAQSDDNVPAYKLLLTDAAPRAGKMLKAITAIIDEESTLDATPGRKALLKNLADIRGSFAVGLANIRAYMLLGNDQFRSNFQAKWAANEKAFKTINGKLKLFTPTQRKQWNAFAAARSEFALLPPRMFEMRSAPDWNLANAWLGTKTAPRAFAIKQALGKMAKSHKLLVEKDTQALHAAVDLTNFTIITATLVATSLGFFIALFLSRGISRAIGSIVNKINSIQETNDLTQRVEINSNDEFGDLATSFNGFVNTLNDIIVSVDNSANDVASASTQIAASSEQMAAGLNEQNQQVTQISAAIAEMSTSIIEVARKSTDATSSAKKSGKMAHEGGQVVEQTIQGINAISDAVTAGAMSVAELGQRGKQIGKIIDVINDIADQTNLLALNAAIEAARAGEHGRGFAVVADEVRKLADRTTKATEEIGVSIQAIQEETALAIDLMNTGTEQVKTGVDRATEAGENLKQMVTSAQEVASMIQSIAVAAEEQSATSEQVTKNVEMVSAVTRQTNEGSQQAAAAATQLSKKAEELQSLVGRFKTKGA